MKVKILQSLKTKAAQLGFNESELESVAEQISNNLSSKENATEDDINAQIEAVIPILKIAQSNATRVINKAKQEQKAEPTNKGVAKENPSNSEDEPAWFRAYRESQDKRIAELERERLTTSRVERLNAIVKDSGMFGTRTLNAFKRMTFANDEEFESFLNETKSDLEAYSKELSEAGLNIAPLGGASGKNTQKEVASDVELEAVAKSI